MNIVDNVTSTLIVIAVIAFIIIRQIRPRKINQRSLLITPAILLFFLLDSFKTFHQTQKGITEIVIMSIVTIALGLLACRQLHVYEGPSGRAMAKGSWTYFLWWLAAFIIKAILSVLFGETSFSSVDQTEIFLPIFLLMITRSGYLYWKVNKLNLILH
jgi:hypothetical protein